MASLCFGLFWSAAASGAGLQLPPQVLLDQLLLRTERLIEADDLDAAVEAMDETSALAAEHELELPADFRFEQARTEFAVGLLGAAKESVTAYLAVASREAESYLEAVALLEDVGRDHVTLNPIAGGEDSLSFVFPDPGHGTNRALYYWASDHLFLWEALRREGVEVEVIVAVRDDAAKGLYEETLFRWTPAGAGLNEDERSFLQAIQAARRHPDPDEIGKWLGWEEAHEIDTRLRSRLHRPPARIDRYTIHFADRLDDSDIGL